MDLLPEARLVADRGLEGNTNQGGKRQVTILSAEAWVEVERQLGRSIDPSTRRANLLVSGIELEASRGCELRIGDARIEIVGETRPCRLMRELEPGLQDALDPHWRGGAYGIVKAGGEIRPGDTVLLALREDASGEGVSGEDVEG